MRDRVLVFGLALCCFFSAAAQEEQDLRLAVDFGFHALSKTENLSLLFNLEPSMKMSEKTRLGLRMAVAINAQTFERLEQSAYQFNPLSDNGFVSVVATYNYHWDELKLRPHVGAGLGPYLLGNFIDVYPTGPGNLASSTEVQMKFQAGLLARGGFVIGKTRFGLEYNFIPKSDVRLANNEKVGTVESSYLGFSIGFSIGKKEK